MGGTESLAYEQWPVFDAELAREKVPEVVINAYGGKEFSFGPEYIIPKPLDPRLITKVATAVARTAMETGVARKHITNWDAYEVELMKRMGTYNQLINTLHLKAKSDLKKIVFANADNYTVLKAIQVVKREKIAVPVLLGPKEDIEAIAIENGLNIEGLQIIDH